MVVMLQHAFKEWAVICKALADGKQALILRKGGVAESEGEFRLEHKRFWLFPTYLHQQEEGLREDARPLLAEVLAQRPPQGKVRLSHFAEVTGVYHVHELLPALMIAHLHLYSDETVQKRFAYRTPGLYVFSVRVYRAKEMHEIIDEARYEGCRSWVELEAALDTEGASAVLGDGAYREVQESLDLLLTPTALA
jgi:hypothetical protein